MKKLLLSAVVLSAVGLNAQSEPAVKTEKAVGIETTAPRATLDVNGDARLRKVELMPTSISTTEIFPDCPCVLTIDKFGVIHRIPKDQFVLAGGSTSGGSQGGGNGSGGSQGGGNGSGGNQGGGNQGGGNQGGGNQSTGGANLGNTVHAIIEDQDDYVVSFIYNSQELQGKIDSDEHKVSIKIPYTNGNGQSYSSAESKTTTTTASAEDGTSSPITMTIKEGTLTSGKGNIEAEITTPQLYKVKKLAPGDIETIAEFKYTVNNQTKKVVLKAIGGIPDKNFGDGDHNFLYLPVTVAGTHPVDGKPYVKKWLNMNLGAEAAKVGSPHFNMLIKKYGHDDVDDALTGSFFQYKRPADGHEFWNSPVTTRTGTDWSGKNPTSIIGKFVGTNNGELWTTAADNDASLWGPNGSNNPCPSGYHVPSRQDWESLALAITGKKLDGSNKMHLQNKLPNLIISKSRQSHRQYSAIINEYANYWTSSGGSVTGDPIGLMSIQPKNYVVTFAHASRNWGYAIRCVQD